MVPLNDAELLALVVVSGDKRTSEDREYSREVGGGIFMGSSVRFLCANSRSGLKPNPGGTTRSVKLPKPSHVFPLLASVCPGGTQSPPPPDFEPILN